MSKILITWQKSDIGYSIDQKRTLKALGLKRLNQTVEHNDDQTIRGMINKVKHLVAVEYKKE